MPACPTCGSTDTVTFNVFLNLTPGSINTLAGNNFTIDNTTIIENAFGANKGNDVIVGNEAPNELWGLNGFDAIDGLGGDDLIYGNRGNDILVGGFGNDTVIGGRGDDVVQGGVGNDNILGNRGNDILTGGFFVSANVTGELGDKTGVDALTGGPGFDRFVFGRGNILHYDQAGNADYAVITDFDPSQDVIELAPGKANYFLGASPNGLPAGTGLFRAGGELIAILAGVGNLSLDASYFQA